MNTNLTTATTQPSLFGKTGDYTSSIQCKLLASHCVFCGRALVDAESVERGAGPECAPRYLDPIKDSDRKVVNGLVYDAAVAAQSGKVAKVMEIADLIAEHGYNEVADRISERFTAAVEKPATNVKIVITEENGVLHVTTPFKRKASDEFINAWRNIPGRRWHSGMNHVPVTSKRELWNLLKTYFHGVYGQGPSGLFRVV